MSVVGDRPKAIRGQLVRWQVLRALRSVHVEFAVSVAEALCVLCETVALRVELIKRYAKLATSSQTS